MSYRAYRIWKFVIMVVLIALMILAVIAGIAWIPIPAGLAAVIVMLLLKRKVREVVVDERSYTIANRASYFTFQVGAIIMCFVGLTLMSMHNAGHTELGPYAETLIFSAIGLLIVYMASVLYYTVKHGSTEEL